MGNYLTKGTTFADGGPCNAALLNAHVDDAILKATAISSQTAKDPAALSDELLINDGGSLKKITLQEIHDLLIYAGSVVQVSSAEYTANTNLTTVLPSDDTIPQNTEGTEIISASITPRFASSTILVTFSGFGAPNSASYLNAALFRDSTVNALIATSQWQSGSNETRFLGFTYTDSPSTVSAVTYKVRVGPGSAVTMRMNGTPVARMFGGVARTTLTLQEIKV